MGLKVAIVGLSQSSRHLAPWNSPEWELWGLGWDSERYHFRRVFEMHDLPELERTFVPVGPYLEKLGHCAVVYMQEAYPQISGSVRYPREEVDAICGDYWESSIGYMLGLAIAEGAEEIGLYGVDMRSDEEHGYQKPNAEYLIGFAKGRGIKVRIPDVSPLLKFSGKFGCVGRYGVTQ